MYLYRNTIRVLIGEHYNCDDIQKRVLLVIWPIIFLERDWHYCVETEYAVSK